MFRSCIYNISYYLLFAPFCPSTNSANCICITKKYVQKFTSIYTQGLYFNIYKIKHAADIVFHYYVNTELHFPVTPVRDVFQCPKIVVAEPHIMIPETNMTCQTSIKLCKSCVSHCTKITNRYVVKVYDNSVANDKGATLTTARA